MNSTGLTDLQLELISQVFKQYPAVQAAKIYGSRAKGTFHDRSDIDLVVFGVAIDRFQIAQMLLDLQDSDLPYAVDENKIYVRNESETVQAVRDEIVDIIRRQTIGEVEPKPIEPARSAPIEAARSAPIELAAQLEGAEPTIAPPKVGVEIVDSAKRAGIVYHTVRDLRNGSVVRNVSRKSARKLWHYAITQYEQYPAEKAEIKWVGELGLLAASKRAGAQRYDLVQRLPDGTLRVYYGVTEDGIHGEWHKVAELAPTVEPAPETEAASEPEVFNGESVQAQPSD